MKISHRLFLSFALVICLSVVVGVVGIIGMQNLQRSGTAMHDEHIVGMDNLGVAIGYMKQSTIDLMNVTISSLYDDRHGALSAQAQFESSASGFENSLSGAITIDELDILYQPIMAEFRGAYLPNSRRVMELSVANIPDHARMLDVNVLMAVNAESTERLNRLIDSLSDAHTAIADYSVSINERQTNIFIAMQWGFLAAAIIFGIMMSLLVARHISKPLIPMASFFERAGKMGNLELKQEDIDTIEKFSQVKDELGRTIKGAASFVKHVINISDELKILGSGDLSSDVQLLSDDDTMGKSLKDLIENLNSMFGEVRESTAQVASGSKQIAVGSQALAQGSAEQSASIQELLSSINEISQKTDANADKAEKAATLANSIKTSAEKGSQQMDGMMAAVKDINISGQNISKVIKSIDDIAFQTNILALNAAVEAARAGQHGKGFAVVAEEVRTLAAKSAEAAKNTETLIADSIEKAELGSRIADDTAASFVEIVSGIDESARLVTEIANSIEEVSEDAEQVSRGVDQVAQVTQQNSATAQQSAAASQEMSGQSDMLEQLIARFKLKDSRHIGSLSSSQHSQAPMQLESQNAPDGDYGKS